ncbi:hypothetical protein ABOB11_26515, partial [Escherichia coli]
VFRYLSSARDRDILRMRGDGMLTSKEEKIMPTIILCKRANPVGGQGVIKLITQHVIGTNHP